ncbi:MAG: acetoin utilization protein AcuB [Gammaproteobacteria bacterium]|jgi:acetoin utilization protein AcuB
MTQRINSVMTPNPVTIGIHERIFTARKLMSEHKIHRLVVVDGDDLQGLITDRDIDLVLDVRLENLNTENATVQEIMFTKPYIVDVDEALVAVLEHFAQHHIGTALITENEQLAGIYDTSDVCRELSARLTREHLS